jgi:hypothetical protein
MEEAAASRKAHPSTPYFLALPLYDHREKKIG